MVVSADKVWQKCLKISYGNFQQLLRSWTLISREQVFKLDEREMNHSTVQIETGDFLPFKKIKIVVFYKTSTGTCHLWMTNNSLSKRNAAILIKTVFTNSWTIFKVRASFPRRIVLITDKGGGSRENDSKRNQQCTLNWHLHTTNLQNWD